ncbi:MAG: zinc ribbon domain-containing protein [Candidatus Caldarchaeum sp.]
MPIYEYECKDCSQQYSELVMTSDEEKSVKCPKCGSNNRERVFSTFGVVSDLSTDMPKPDLSGLPPSIRNRVQITDYIEEKDRPKANR